MRVILSLLLLFQAPGSIMVTLVTNDAATVARSCGGIIETLATSDVVVAARSSCSMLETLATGDAAVVMYGGEAESDEKIATGDAINTAFAGGRSAAETHQTTAAANVVKYVKVNVMMNGKSVGSFTVPHGTSRLTFSGATVTPSAIVVVTP